MNVKRLKQLIENLPDNTQVLVPAFDHSYRYPRIFKTTALLDNSGNFCEDFGVDTPESEYGNRMDVLVIE